MIQGPDYGGGGLVNLMAELEARLIGSAPSARLRPELSASIPEAETYVLLLVDGLGVAQLPHAGAGPLAAANRGILHSPFPSTTSVSLATVATGLAPSQHGLVSHLARMDETGEVVNTLKWVDLAGLPVTRDFGTVLHTPNLWERLRGSGVEPITVQPGPFEGSPLSQVLYRGARFEGTWNDQDLIDATVQLAEGRRRLIFTYLWQVDFAGHVSGLESKEFDEAIRHAAIVWDSLARRLPPHAALIGTADHGLVEYREEDKLMIRDAAYDDVVFAGDPRGVLTWGPSEVIAQLSEVTGATSLDPSTLIGPGVTETARRRVGENLLLAPEGRVILPPGFDKRLRCYHGGATLAEIEVPLLVR